MLKYERGSAKSVSAAHDTMATPDFAVDRMPDFHIVDSDSVRGFSRVVSRVSDVAQYVVPIMDFGRAVATFQFEFPPDMDQATFTRQFEEFVKTSCVFMPAADDAISAEEYRVRSLTRLGPDGYVGVYACGAESADKYMLAVQSYDAWAAEHFQTTQLGRIVSFVERGRTPVERAQKLEKLCTARKLMDHADYQSAISRSDVNRRYIAACFFAAMGISVRTEMHTLPEMMEKIVIVSNAAGVREFPIVFLAREGNKFMRVFNWAYRFTDVLDGAPWHMCIHEGLRMYYGTEAAKEPLRNKHVAGAPFGSPHMSRNGGAQPPTENATAIERIVLWNSSVSVLFAVDPVLRVPTNAAITQLEREYSLGLLRVQHWRAIRVAITPPHMEMLSLRDHVMFSKTPKIAVPYHAYPEVMEMWAALFSFRENRARIAGQLPRAEDSMPPDYVLPSLHDLFGDETKGSRAVNMERGILQNMYIVHDDIMHIMNLMRHGPPPTRGELGHEMILREAGEIPEPVPIKQEPDASETADDPIGVSDIETSADMSETDLHILRASRRTHTVNPRAGPSRATEREMGAYRARQQGPVARTQAPPRARPNVVPVKLTKFDTGAESDSYAELMVSEDDTTR